MEYIVSNRPKKRHPFDIEAERLKKSNARLDRLNDALAFSVKALTVLFIFQILTKLF